MTELEKHMPPGSKWNSLRIAVFVLIGTAVALGGLLWGRYRMETVLADRIDRMFSRYSPLVSIQYEDIGIGLFGRSIRIHGIRVTPIGSAAPIRIEKLVVHRFDHSEGVPEILVASAESVQIPEGGGYLDDLAIPGLIGNRSADLFLDLRYELEDRRLTVRRFSTTVRDLGALSVAARIGNIDPENAAISLVFPYALLFEGMSLVYSDDSLVSGWLAELAARENMTPAAYARVVKERLMARAARADRDGNPAAADVLREFAAFLDRPERLNITMRPERPVPFGRLLWSMRLETLVDLLNIRVEANAGP